MIELHKFVLCSNHWKHEILCWEVKIFKKRKKYFMIIFSVDFSISHCYDFCSDRNHDEPREWWNE